MNIYETSLAFTQFTLYRYNMNDMKQTCQQMIIVSMKSTDRDIHMYVYVRANNASRFH